MKYIFLLERNDFVHKQAESNSERLFLEIIKGNFFSFNPINNSFSVCCFIFFNPKKCKITKKIDTCLPNQSFKSFINDFSI